MSQSPSSSPSLRHWMRGLHLYMGLFISPFLAIFAVSAILVNHGWRAPGATAATHYQVVIALPESLKGLDRAQDILRQANVAGEVDFFHDTPEGFRILVSRPTRKITVNVNLSAKTADIEDRPTNLAESLVYLHKYPGPHNANIRGNWLFTRLWGVLADGTVYLLLLVLVAGIYLWLTLKSRAHCGTGVPGRRWSKFRTAPRMANPVRATNGVVDYVLPQPVRPMCCVEPEVAHLRGVVPARVRGLLCLFGAGAESFQVGVHPILAQSPRVDRGVSRKEAGRPERSGQAQELMGQLALSGEINQIITKADSFEFHLNKPGEFDTVTVNPAGDRATVKQVKLNVWGVLNSLHHLTGAPATASRHPAGPPHGFGACSWTPPALACWRWLSAGYGCGINVRLRAPGLITLLLGVLCCGFFLSCL